MFKNLSFFSFLLFILFIFQVQTVFSCGCPGSSTETIVQYAANKMKKADAVFSGEVISTPYRKMSDEEIIKSFPKYSPRNIGFEMLTVRIKINRWWKGFNSKEITLLTGTYRISNGTGMSNSCEVSFKTGEKVLVFANGKDKNHLQTHSCSGTGKIENRKGIVSILGNGRAPK